jgi:hypothetical protein
VRIDSVLATVSEIVSFRGIDGKPFVGVAGGTVRASEIYGFETGMVTSDALHDFRFALAYYSTRDALLIQAASHHVLGTLRIGAVYSDPSMDLPLAWFNSNDQPFSFHIDPLQDLFCNFDSMHHAQKGSIGLFVQQTTRFTAQNVSIDGVKNFGARGSGVCGHYIETPHQGNTGSEHRGYTGSQSYGIMVAASRDVSLSEFEVKNVHGKNGDAMGVYVCNDVTDVELQHGNVVNISVGVSVTAPNEALKSCFFVLGDRVNNANVMNLSSV